MRVLVTGGAGFIGGHVVERLIEDGNEVVVLDDLSNGRLENLAALRDDKRLSLKLGDIRNAGLAYKCLRSAEAVVHLAALTGTRDPAADPVELTEVNVTGTVNLLEAARKGSVQRFIFASSAAVYGDSRRFPLGEGFPTSALSSYAASKIASEQFCRSFRETYGLKTISLRLFNVYGPRQLPRADGAVIPQFVSRLKRGLPPEIIGDGQQIRDFVYVGDVVECIARLLKVDTKDETLNVGSGIPVTINHLADCLLRIYGSSQRPFYKAAKGREIRNSYASTAKLTKCLAFRPRTILDEGLKQLAREDKTLPLLTK